MTYDEIVQGLRDSNYELQNEGRRVAAGLKTEQDTAGIIERYAWLYAEESLDAVGEPVDEERRRVRAALLQMHGPAYAPLLKRAYDIDGFEAAEDKEYDPVRQAADLLGFRPR